MSASFDEERWKPAHILEFWQLTHGNLEIKWHEQFLSNGYVMAMCTHHPAHIRAALRRNKNIRAALSLIYEIETLNEEKTDQLLGEPFYAHQTGITNAHHGNRRTDPFDTGREDLLFKCERCNLKLSTTRKSSLSGSQNICDECY